MAEPVTESSDPAVNLPPNHYIMPTFLGTPISGFDPQKPFLAVRIDEWDSLYQVDGWSRRGQRKYALFYYHFAMALDKLRKLSGMPVVAGYAKLYPEPEDESDESDDHYESDSDGEGSHGDKVGLKQGGGKNADVEERPAKVEKQDAEVVKGRKETSSGTDSEPERDINEIDGDDDSNSELVDGLLRVVALSGPRFHSTREKRLAVVQALGMTENDIISVYPRPIPC
ncbi:hypothetical protein PLICRDRAFT_46219 [Plicaturopsis crispa FD-325 SS-3]|uniref:Uncharacterized protein n=1 Tax=Plicaturopsis crispa FD-325 SS-3 TaxID=944288 RepID=A0A0C9SR47_PLICR|nr:hypothetical protein PLICRDRAFT_46219 [Plicaturopsis crispa FD-325 SS-3]